MPVLDLKPHTLSYLIVSNGYEDDNGDWHEGEETWSEEISCHAVPAGSANIINYEDGRTASYSYTIGRIDPDCKEFDVGERIRLHIGESVKEYSVKGFHRYQLQAKLWV